MSWPPVSVVLEIVFLTLWVTLWVCFIFHVHLKTHRVRIPYIISAILIYSHFVVLLCNEFLQDQKSQTMPCNRANTWYIWMHMFDTKLTLKMRTTFYCGPCLSSFFWNSIRFSFIILNIAIVNSAFFMCIWGHMWSCCVVFFWISVQSCGKGVVKPHFAKLKNQIEFEPRNEPEFHITDWNCV